MKTSEIFIVLVMGFTGYVVVAALLQHFQKKREPDRAEEHAFRDAEKNGKDEADSPAEFDLHPHWSTVLGVPRTASDDEIRAAFKKQISLYHPDKVASLEVEFNDVAQSRTKEINAAYGRATHERK